MAKRSVLMASILVSVAALLPAPAWANNDSGIRVPNGQVVNIFYSGIDANFAAAVDWVRANRINPTDVQTFRTGTTTNANIRVGQGNYAGWPAAQWGEYQCMAGFWFGSVFICTDGRVRFHTDRQWDAVTRRDLACHELGHSLGLAHWEDGRCMAAVVPNGAANNLGYGNHSLGHLNGWY